MNPNETAQTTPEETAAETDMPVAAQTDEGTKNDDTDTAMPPADSSTGDMQDQAA